MSAFRRVASRSIHRGKVVEMRIDTIEGPDGASFDRDVVHHPGAVAVVPVHVVDGRMYATLVRQYRAPLDAFLLEIPAGKRDITDEPPEVTAERELEEECGLRATSMVRLVEFENSPGFCDERCTVFLATDLSRVPTQHHGMEEEHMTFEDVALDAVPAMIAKGELTDAKSIIGLLLARNHLLG